MFWGEKLKNQLATAFLNKKVAEEVDESYLSHKNSGSVNDYGSTIEATLIDKPYLDGSSLDEDDEFREEENWSVSHEIVIELDDDRKITSFSISDRIWGDDSLGDYDPSDVYNEDEYFNTAISFLNNITSSQKG